MTMEESKYNFFNQTVFSQVPADALRILDFGCDTANLSVALKNQNPKRYVAGVEIVEAAAEVARQKIDKVYSFNVDTDGMQLGDDRFDTVIFADVLEHLYDPKAVLEQMRPFILEGGQVIACIPNIQHHSIFRALLRGDFQYQKVGLLDDTHIRFFARANIYKLFLDAAYFPRLAARIVTPRDCDPLASELAGIVKQELYGTFNEENLDSYQFVFKATPLSSVDISENIGGMTFICLSDDVDARNNNLLASPIFGESSLHEVIFLPRNDDSATLCNKALRQAQNSIVVILSEEAYLPSGWSHRLHDQLKKLRLLDESDTSWVCGVRGLSDVEGSTTPIGACISNYDSICHGNLPSAATSLEYDLFVVHRDTPLKFAEQAGSSAPGENISLQPNCEGVSQYVVNAPYFLNNQRESG
jgi:2-polyprenyl-3-methyl-5-hydroxy-6-metoxy-1,4-benzoquinol methylase